MDDLGSIRKMPDHTFLKVCRRPLQRSQNLYLALLDDDPIYWLS